MPNPVGHNITRGRWTAALWFGILGGPLAALTAQLLNYMLVPAVCRSHNDPAVMALLHVVSLVLLAVTLGAAWIAWSALHRQGSNAEQSDAGDLVGRGHFMAQVGVGLSLLSALVVIAEWIPVFILHPCFVT